MKKRISFLGIVFTLILLVGCGSNPKSEFISFLEKDEAEKQFNYDFSIKFSDLSLVDGTSSKTSLDITANQIKNVTAKGNLQLKRDKNKLLSNLSMTADYYGMEIPLNLKGELSDDSKLFMSTDTISSVIDLYSDTLLGEDSLNYFNTYDLAGKYLNILETDEMHIPITDLVEGLEAVKDSKKGMLIWLRDLDKNKFTQKEDTVSLKLTREDFIELFEKSKLDSEESKESFKMFKEMYESFEITYQINLKKAQQKMKITMALKRAVQDEFGFEKATVTTQFKKSNKKIDLSLPEKSKIMTEEELFDQFDFFDDDDYSYNDDTIYDDLLDEQVMEKSEINMDIFTPKIYGEDEDSEVKYESNDDQIVAFVPDYNQYTSKEVKTMLGEPTKKVTDQTEVSELFETTETDLIAAEFQLGNITENQGKAFIFAATDLKLAMSFGLEIEAWIYDGDKPNVYFVDDEVNFITPKTKYIDFKGKLETTKL